MSAKRWLWGIGLILAASVLFCCDRWPPVPSRYKQGIMASPHAIGSYKIVVEHNIGAALEIRSGWVYGDGGYISFDDSFIMILKDKLVVSNNYYGTICHADNIRIGYKGIVDVNGLTRVGEKVPLSLQYWIDRKDYPCYKIGSYVMLVPPGIGVSDIRQYVPLSSSSCEAFVGGIPIKIVDGCIYKKGIFEERIHENGVFVVEDDRIVIYK